MTLFSYTGLSPTGLSAAIVVPIIAIIAITVLIIIIVLGVKRWHKNQGMCMCLYYTHSYTAYDKKGQHVTQNYALKYSTT